MRMAFCCESGECIASILTMEYFMNHLLEEVGCREDWKTIKVLEFSNAKLEKNLTALNGVDGFVGSWKEIRNLTFLFSTALAHFS